MRGPKPNHLWEHGDMKEQPLFSVMKRERIEKIIEVLRRHRLIEQVTEEQIQRAMQMPRFFDILLLLLPERRLWYDAECIYSPEDFVAFLQRCAKVTGGTWMLEDPTAIFEPISGDDYELLATVSFLFQGERIQWQFKQVGDYISVDFLNELDEFMRIALESSFYDGPYQLYGGQDRTTLYLPLAAQEELVKLFLGIRLEWPDADELTAIIEKLALMVQNNSQRNRRHTRPWNWQQETFWQQVKRESLRMLAFVHRDMSDTQRMAVVVWGHIPEDEKKAWFNVPNARGQLPLHAAAERKLSVVVDDLLLCGADPFLKDQRGKTTFDYTSTLALRERLQKGSEEEL